MTAGNRTRCLWVLRATCSHWATGACLNRDGRNLSDSEVGGAGGGWGLSHKKEIHDKVTDLWIRTLLIVTILLRKN